MTGEGSAPSTTSSGAPDVRERVRAPALVDAQDREQHVRDRGIVGVAEDEERLAGVLQLVGSGLLGAKPGLAELEQQRRPRGVVGRGHFEGRLEELRGRRMSPERRGAAARLHRRPPGALLELGGRLLRRPCKLQSREVVVGHELRPVVGAVAGDRLEPLRGALVLRRPAGTRELAVRHVADEDVPEGVLVFVRDRGATLAADELLALERVQPFLDEGSRDGRDVSEGACPEDLAEHGCVVEQGLLVRRERVESRGDDALHGLGKRELLAAEIGARVGARQQPAVAEHTHVLAGVEGISTCAVEERGPQPHREYRPLEQRRDEVAHVLVRQRLERDGEGIPLRGSPARPPLEQVRARCRDDEERHVAGPVHEVLDEVEQRVVGPVEILEDEGDR